MSQTERGAAGLAGQTPKQTFTIVVERDPETEWLVAAVVELPGCYSRAPDLPALETNVREAISAYLATAEQADIDAPRPSFVGAWRVDISA